MMGNFSFGDYFKEGAIAQAWELSLEGWQMDPERLWVTVYEGDDAVPARRRGDRAVAAPSASRPSGSCALGEDNFWKAGPTGPCGPCSELFYDRGPEHGCGRPLGGGPTSAARMRLRPRARVLEPRLHAVRPRRERPDAAAQAVIDTGAGVERISALLQGVHSVYETDGFQAVISACESWSGAKYADGGVSMRALRVLADHGRGMAFLATDGVIPRTSGAATSCAASSAAPSRTAHRIGLPSPFLTKLHGVIVDQFGEAYPDSSSTAARWPRSWPARRSASRARSRPARRSSTT